MAIPSGVIYKSILIIIIVFPLIALNYSNIIAIDSQDTSPPHVKQLIRNPTEDIMPWDIVNITAYISDNESGIKEAWIYYTVGETPTGKEFNRTDMKLVDGDIYNGVYTGFLPPQPEGTLVWYYLNISDNAGNYIIYPNYESYEMYKVSKQYSSISVGYIEIIDINPRNRSIALKVSLIMILPSSDEYEKINVWINQISENRAINTIFIPVPRESGRFQYKIIKTLYFSLLGEPEKFPQDRYKLTLNFTFHWSRVDKLHGGPIIISRELSEAWDIINSERELEPELYNETLPMILYNITIERAPKSKVPFELLLYSIVILAAMTLVLPPSELGKRIEIYVGLFVFNFTFLFSIRDYLPLTPRFTYAEMTIMFTTMFIAVVTVASILAYLIEKRNVKHKNIWGILIETFFLIVIIGYNSQRIQSTPYLTLMILFIALAYVLRLLFIELILVKFEEVAMSLDAYINRLWTRVKRIIYRLKIYIMGHR